MKFFNLLFSLCLAFMLCTSWVSAFSSLATPEPTPPTGAPVDGTTSTGFSGPPSAETTNATPETSTIYPIYG
ncbi:uncharacterized protein LOC6613724 [Drosophila sechellia]|uniref:GM17888 n=1 Tax=Drosophila sechellia TaxID=7238 RepID=B4I255_DROSE|nr:uncharacterized protein LOC6613724 [Drosophila sechellia]EDW54612.1 GM17888 [Drosophila sechellia]